MAHRRPGKALASAIAEPAPAPEVGSGDEVEESKKAAPLPLPPVSGRSFDVLIALAFFAVALFARLYNISDPAGIVFDEVVSIGHLRARGGLPTFDAHRLVSAAALQQVFDLVRLWALLRRQ